MAAHGSYPFLFAMMYPSLSPLLIPARRVLRLAVQNTDGIVICSNESPSEKTHLIEDNATDRV